MLDAPGAAHHGRTRKPGSERFCSPNERAEPRLTQPDNVGKAYLKAMSDLGWWLLFPILVIPDLIRDPPQR